MAFLHTAVALIVTLGVLITFHEFGHFWVARRCGVKVLRFSIGFGKPIWRWQDRHGTEFVLAWIPLGGYVRMVDEREGAIAEEDKPYAFNRKPVMQRIAIVAAGPIANFLLAIVAYWVLFISGTQVLAPVVGHVLPQSPAAQSGLAAGDEITQVDHQATHSWQDVGLALLDRLGDTGEVRLEVSSHEHQITRELRLPIQAFMVGQKEPQPLQSLGITPWRPDIPARIGRVLEEGPAAEAGLKAGDLIQAINGQVIKDWPDLVAHLRASPGQSLTLQIQRDQQTRSLTVTPESRSLDDGQTIGWIGAGVQMPPMPASMQREIRYNPAAALAEASAKTWEMSTLTLGSIGKMLTGLISPDNLSGPITIARVASDSARSGWESFISFLAYVSISLGVLNLLPIPVLDGGHLLFYVIEAIRGRPVPERIQEQAMRLGMVILASVMVMAFYFDLMRL